MGIPCKHILMIFNFLNVNFIPKSYLSKRWMKNARNRICDDFFVDETGSGCESDIVFVNQIMRSTYALSMQCKVHENARKSLSRILDGAREQIDDLFENIKLEEPKVYNEEISKPNNM